MWCNSLTESVPFAGAGVPGMSLQSLAFTIWTVPSLQVDVLSPACKRVICWVEPRGYGMGRLPRLYLKDEGGAVAAEYALLVSLLGAAIAFAASSLGTTISTAMGNVAALL